MRVHMFELRRMLNTKISDSHCDDLQDLFNLTCFILFHIVTHIQIEKDLLLI